MNNETNSEKYTTPYGTTSPMRAASSALRERDFSWNRVTVRSVRNVVLASLPPALGKFIATVAANTESTNETLIVHLTHFDLWGSTGKVLTDPTVSMSTLCSPLGNILYGVMAERSPLGGYCLSCGSAIVQTRKPLTLVSSLGTISFNGRNFYRNPSPILSLQLKESPNVSRNAFRALTRTRMRLYGKGGNSTSWRAVGLNYGHTFTTDRPTIHFAGTEPVERY